MYAFKPDPAGDPAERYAALLQAAAALVEGEPDAIANMANISALLWQYVPDLNWAGFYRMVAGELVLGPFIGKPACRRIAVGQGVCGTAVATRSTQRVADVHAFAGHIACDAASRAELVVPVFATDGGIVAVLDLDSPVLDRFSVEDAAAIERVMQMIAPAIA